MEDPTTMLVATRGGGGQQEQRVPSLFLTPVMSSRRGGGGGGGGGEGDEAAAAAAAMVVVGGNDAASSSSSSLPSSARKPTLNELEKKIATLEQENFDLKMRFYYLRDEKRATSRGGGGNKGIGGGDAYRRREGGHDEGLGQEEEEEEEGLAERVYHLSCVLHEKETEAEEARERLGELNRMLMEGENRYRMDVGLLQEQNKLLSLELSDVNEKYEMLVSEQARRRDKDGQRLVELEEQLSKSQSKEVEREETVISCGKQLGAYMKSIKAMEEAMTAKDRELERHRESIKYLELALKDIERKYSKAVEEIRTKSEVAEQLRAAESEREALSQEVSRLARDLGERDQQVGVLTDDKRTLEEELVSFKSEAQSVAQMEAFEIVRLQDELKRATDQLSKTRDESSLVEDVLSQQVHDYKVLKGRLQEHTTKEERLLKELKKWESKARTLQGAKDVVTERVRELEDRLAVLLDKHRALQDNYNACRKELGAQQGLVSTLRASLDAINQQNGLLHKHIGISTRNSARKPTATAASARASFSSSYPPAPSSIAASPAAQQQQQQPQGASSTPKATPVGRKRPHLQQQATPAGRQIGTGRREAGGRRTTTATAAATSAAHRDDATTSSRPIKTPLGTAQYQDYDDDGGDDDEGEGRRYYDEEGSLGVEEGRGGGDDDDARGGGPTKGGGLGERLETTSPPALPSPEAILSKLRELREGAGTSEALSAFGGADFVHECLRMLGREEESSRDPNMTPLPRLPAKSKKDSALQPVVKEETGKLQVTDVKGRKSTSMKMPDGDDGDDDASALEAFYRMFEASHPDVKAKLETILGPLDMTETGGTN